MNKYLFECFKLIAIVTMRTNMCDAFVVIKRIRILYVNNEFIWHKFDNKSNTQRIEDITEPILKGLKVQQIQHTKDLYK